MTLTTSKFTDYARFAFTRLLHTRKRTFLTLVGIFIGIASVVALVAIGQGFQQAINSEFTRIGADKLLIVPGGGLGLSSAFSQVKFTDSDVTAFKRVNGISQVSPVTLSSATVQKGQEAKSARVLGINAGNEGLAAREFYDLKTTQGRLLQSEFESKALIGSNIAEGKFFQGKVKIGDVILISNARFAVQGVIKRTGNPTVDNAVVIPMEKSKQLFQTLGYYAMIGKVSPGLKPIEVSEKAKIALRSHRNLKKGSEDFSVQTSAQIIESFNNIFAMVQVIVIGIAAISLVIGGVGITNTMYTSVLERTREIGVMKSIGARNSDVALLFVIESSFLGLAGGAAGALIGVALAKLIEYAALIVLGTQLLTAAVSLELITGALLFAFLIGTTSGALPALRAAQLKPITALRYE